MKNLYIKINILIAALYLFWATPFSAQPGKNYEGTTPKYIFYFIGDGMGLSQVKAAEMFLSSVYPDSAFILNELPSAGFISTHAYDRFITGSAASGTALACGQKTSIGTIAMNHNHSKNFKSVAKAAKEQGKKIGIITSVSLDHATPAVFYANQVSRSNYYEISMDLINSGFDYFAGGLVKSPYAKATVVNQGSGQSEVNNSKNFYSLARKADYKIASTRRQFEKLNADDGKAVVFAQELAGGNAIRFDIDQDEKDISLAQMTQKGIDVLKDSENGFFMMVEGGKIDWACHANDAATTIREVLSFNNAVKTALDFYRRHPEETLIIATGDHETGGLTMGFAGSHYESSFELLKNQKVSFEKFSNIIGNLKYNKNLSFEEVLTIIEENFGLGNKELGLELTKFERNQLKEAYEYSFHNKANDRTKDELYLLYGIYDPVTVKCTHILAQKAGISWTTYSHTGTPIPVRAIGPGSELFTGYYDNTDMAKNIFALLHYSFPN